MPALEKTVVGVGKKPALLVVDASVGFTDPNCPLGGEFSAEVAAIRTLADRFRSLGFPVFFTTVAYSAPEQASVFRAKIPALNLLEAGSPLVEIDPRLGRRPNEPVIVKYWPSAFVGTDLKARLDALGVDTLFVTGFTTSGCVRASGVDSLSANFRTIVVRDGCGDRDPPAHEANLYDLNAKYGDVVSLDQALDLVSGVAA